VKTPLSIIIFADKADESAVRLKCRLLKCGIYNFTDAEACANCRFVNDCDDIDDELTSNEKVGLFIVSRESITSDRMAVITAVAQRLAVPVLQL